MADSTRCCCDDFGLRDNEPRSQGSSWLGPFSHLLLPSSEAWSCSFLNLL